MIRYFFTKLHIWWNNKFHHSCDEMHTEHVSQIVHDDGPEPEEWFVWDPISADDVEERFGGTIMDDLVGNDNLFNRPADEEFKWLVNGYGILMAHFQDRIFIYEDSEWYELPRQ